MNRGSASAVRLPDVRMTGFNEAPIHESGKYGAYPRGMPI